MKEMMRRIVSSVLLTIIKKINYVLSSYYTSKLYACGKDSILGGMNSHYEGLDNISVGENVKIPAGATIFSTNAKLKIGNNVLFGPNPTIITGDHRIDVIGSAIADVQTKLPENDQDVVIEDDVWCGANVTILKGVTIGRGSVVAAGSVVVHSCPPYSIIGGVPAKVLKYRFTPEQIREHEAILYHTN